ncbi:hypothetical protein BKA60DRAFT_670557 [Fusarium oxysporum]|nr:hypothetical protein BKA60DRAFT_670557 [Fusarium oxysporum]
MASYSCPTCDGSYKDILEHICKKHPTEAYTDQQLQPLNLARCPHCSTACQGAQGIKAHSAKIHRIKGTSNISTLPRIRTYPATRAQYQPHPSIIALAKELAARRKRPAKTPSPETARPSQRQRQQPSSPSPHPLLSSQSISQGFEDILLDLETPPSSPPDLQQQHQEAIAPILAKGSIQKLLAYAKIPIVEKKLQARQAAIFKIAAQKAAEAFIKRPTEKNLLYFLILPRILAPSPAKRAAKMLERGFLGRASRALIDPTPIAADSAENRAILLEKHPIGSKDPFSRKTRPRPGQPITEEAILASIATIGKEKAPGLISKADSLVIAFLRLLADMIRQGTAPGADLLCASRLIGLEKPDGGIRPIAMGDLIYKVAMKAILKTSFSSSMLLPFQLGVSSPGGVEPAIFLLEEAIAGPNKADFQYITSVDLHNAFNSRARPSIASSVASFAPTFYRAATWAYNNPSLLVLPDGSTIASSKGQAIAALQDLPKQHSLLLLRGSIHLLLRHLLRQLNPEAIMTLVARSPAERPKEPDPYLLSLPVREGGLGLPLHKELAQGLYQAAKETAKKILKGITSFFTSYPSLSTSEA